VKLAHGRVGQDRIFRNVLLPNGDVVLCCMDYGLDHILGNLEPRALACSVAAVAEAAEDVAGRDGGEGAAERFMQRVDRPGGE